MAGMGAHHLLAHGAAAGARTEFHALDGVLVVISVGPDIGAMN
ncbi:hypothetical protein [Streptomyces sp. NPDC006285]